VFVNPTASDDLVPGDDSGVRIIPILESNSGYLFVVERDNPFAHCTQFLARSRSRHGGIRSRIVSLHRCLTEEPLVFGIRSKEHERE
jgi:hypothetical protein